MAGLVLNVSHQQTGRPRIRVLSKAASRPEAPEERPEPRGRPVDRPPSPRAGCLTPGARSRDSEVWPITVTTYDSAYIHMKEIGNRFRLVVFDEAHHLPGPTSTRAPSTAWRRGGSASRQLRSGLISGSGCWMS